MTDRPDNCAPRAPLLPEAPTQHPYKYHLLLPAESVSLASKVLPCLVLVELRERRGSEGRRTSQLIVSPHSSSSAKALPESVRVWRSFPSSNSVDCGSSVRILRILTENRLLSPSNVLESWLVRIILRHYFIVIHLPIIVSHSFTTLMLFVYLCIM
jgi:hypothetical protein